MLKILPILIVLVVPCVSAACGCSSRYQRPVAHAIRIQESNPIAKHPITIRRVATARRRIRY